MTRDLRWSAAFATVLGMAACCPPSASAYDVHAPVFPITNTVA